MVLVLTTERRAVCPAPKPIEGEVRVSVVAGGEGRNFSTNAIVWRVSASKTWRSAGKVHTGATPPIMPWISRRELEVVAWMKAVRPGAMVMVAVLSVTPKPLTIERVSVSLIVLVLVTERRAICPAPKPIEGETRLPVVVSGGEGRKFSTSAIVCMLVESKTWTEAGKAHTGANPPIMP